MICSVVFATAHAQVIEEVVVTAQKRAESVQDVPISVTAMDEDFIKKASMGNIVDIVSSVPGLNARVDATTQSVLAIRGVGTNAFSVSADASVGVFLDDVYAGHPLISAQSFFDVERVEVVKGPQGTLFGRNTSAGAISVISKKADRNEVYSDFRAGYGSEEQVVAEGVLNYSNADDWGVRMGARYESRDGTFKNTTTGNELNNKDDLVARIGIQKDFSDRFRSQLLVQYSSVGSRFGLIDITDRKGATKINTVAQNARNDQDVKTWRTALRLEYDINDAMTLTSISSYLDATMIAIPFDADMTTLRILEFQEPQDFEYLSQELRLNGSHGNIDWFIGASVRDEQVTGDTQLRYSDNDVVLALVGDTCPNVLGTVPLPATLCNANVLEPSVAKADNFSWGIYGDVAWQVTDKLRFTVGARYSEDEKDIALNTPSPGSATNILLGDNLLELSTTGPLRNTDSWTDFSPRFAVNYDITEEVMGYANVSLGYKAGGFNSAPDIPVAALAAGQAQSIPGFNPEDSTAYEVGFKSMLFDRRLRLNVAGFFIDYSDYQVETLSGLAFIIQNVATAENIGVDVEAEWLVNEHFDILASYSYIDSEIQTGTINDPGTGLPIDITGNPLPYAPENSFSLIGTYTYPIQWGELSLRVAYSHTDKFFISPLADTALEFNEEMDTVDLRLGFESSDGKWGVAVIGQNINDDRWFSNPSLVLGPIGTPNIGALWRGEITYHFD